MPLPSAENTLSAPARKCVTQGPSDFALAKPDVMELKPRLPGTANAPEK
jgi:hypothetical protein